MRPPDVGIPGPRQIIHQRPQLPPVPFHEIGAGGAPAQRFDAQTPGAGKQIQRPRPCHRPRFQNVKDSRPHPFRSRTNAGRRRPLQPHSPRCAAGNAHQIGLTRSHSNNPSFKLPTAAACGFRPVSPRHSNPPPPTPHRPHPHTTPSPHPPPAATHHQAPAPSSPPLHPSFRRKPEP